MKKLPETPLPHWARQLANLRISLIEGLPVYDVVYQNHWVITKIFKSTEGLEEFFCHLESDGRQGTSLARSLVPDLTLAAGYDYFIGWLGVD